MATVAADTSSKSIQGSAMNHVKLPAVILVLIAIPEMAQAAVTGLEQVASGLSSPVYATHAPNDPNRLFIVELGSPSQTSNASASIRILNLQSGELDPTPFLTITGVNTNIAGGVGGLAFHPEFETNGKFYVNVTVSDDLPDTPFSTNIREYTVSENPNVANSEFNTIITVPAARGDHNAGWLDFSPQDGYLYIPTGDGGCCWDIGTGHVEPTGNAQDLTDNLNGKLLRIDVNGDDFPGDDARNYAIPATNPFVGVEGDDEIWAYGLRNPYRASFDRLTADLWIGDVGETQREEIDFQPADSTGGENYGWRLREGTVQTLHEGGGPRPPDNVEPIYDYARIGNTKRTIIGGYVYRGPDPDLQGLYFFADAGSRADASTRRFYTFEPDDPSGTIKNITALLSPEEGDPTYPVGLGEDAVGNLYVVFYQTNDVYRIVTDNLLTGDYDADGDVDEQDYNTWKTNFGATEGAGLAADGNGDGEVDAADYTVWRDNLGASVHDLGAGSGSASVPEPAAATLLAMAVFSTLLFRRRQITLD